MKALISYEFNKVFQKIKWSSLTLVILTAFFLLTVTGGFEVVRVFSLMGLTVAILFSLIAPLVISITSYYKDLNNQHAVFETYLPQNGWKRLAAKYISYYALIQLGIFFAAILAGLAILIVSKAMPSGISLMNLMIQEFPEMQELKDMLFYFRNHLSNTIWFGLKILLLMGISSLTGTIFINFFITLHSVLRHRFKGATLATFLLATVSGIVLSSLNNNIAGHKTLFESSNIAVHPETILNYILSFLAFYAIGYMLEHKTELK